MLEKIHYMLAALCGIAMVIAILAPEKSIEGCPWAAMIAGVYLVTKVLLIGKK